MTCAPLAARVAGIALLGAVLMLPAAGPAFAARPVQDDPPSASDPVNLAVREMYNLDFAAAHRILDAHIAGNPSDPLGHSARAAAYVFAEFHRLRILEFDFFESDDSLTDQKRLKPDPAVREKIFASTADARRLARAVLAGDPANRHALFALTMAVGVETQYTALVEKGYIRGGSLSKESQALADRMITLKPPVYDAYVTLGAIEYTVANLNMFYRFLARFQGLRGDKARAMEHLQIVVAKGRYYGPYAKILLSVFYLREGRTAEARGLLEELRRDFPANPLFPREISRIDLKLAAGAR